MLSRRNLRIKVMQALYIREQTPDASVSEIQRKLFTSIHNAYRLALYNLRCLIDVIDYVNKVADIKHNKYIPTEEDKQFSTKIYNNPVIRQLVDDRTFQQLLKKEKLGHPDESVTKPLFKKISDTPEYRSYVSKATDTREDAAMILQCYETILTEELYHQHLEEQFMNWWDDDYIIVKTLTQLVERLGEGSVSDPFGNFLGTMEEEKAFASNLLFRIIEKETELSAMIEPKLTNWDKDRVAAVDMLLMKMALGELLYFPTIPVKVSINEYIDISKNYSTPKSKDFVNGIIDNLMKELREDGKIQKTGRGLVE